MGQIAIGKAGAMITDLYLNGVTAAPTDQLHTSRAMRQGIVHQVAQGILQALPVRGDHPVVRANRDRPRVQLGSTPTAFGDFGQQITNFHRLPVEAQPMFVCRGEQQQLFGQSAEPVSLLADRHHGCAKIITFGGIGLGELDLGFDDRQRRTQLVAGIGQKAPLLIQRVLLCGLGSPDSVEHVVQRAAEAPDLIRDWRHGQRCPLAIGKIISADCRRPLSQGLDRTQGEPGNPIGDATRGNQSSTKSDYFHT
jgi:hypothetical protein